MQKKSLLFIYLSVVVLFLVSCEEEQKNPLIQNIVPSVDTVISVGDSLVYSAEVDADVAFDYRWMINASEVSGDPVYKFYAVESGDFEVKLVVSNSYGIDSSSVNVTVEKLYEVIDFEELVTSDEGYWNGSDGSGSFTSVNTDFDNFYNVDWSSWSGFSYSILNDTVVSGYGNQYSVYNSQNSENTFALFFPPFGSEAFATFTGGIEYEVKSLKICNSTYAALDILNGSTVGKKFGGESGDDPDYFKVIIKGFNKDGIETGDVEYYLADFRFEDNSKDYVLNEWVEVDITSLGEINKLSFSFESSDVGNFGINTPQYVCVDDITYKIKE